MLDISDGDTAAAPTHPRQAPTGDELTVGQLVGRFVILNRLGAGGMGIVYAAYDPELDRKVALKLIRPGLHSADDAPALQVRLVREAQAMARVAHPNVAAVYERRLRHGEAGLRGDGAHRRRDAGAMAGWRATLAARPKSWPSSRHAGRGLAGGALGGS